MLFTQTLQADSLLAGLAVGIDLLKGMFLAARDSFDLHFPLQGVLERNELMVGSRSQVLVISDTIRPKILPAINAMGRSIFLLATSLALHLVGILHGARD